ncbi:hypothetical protein GII33_03815 [Gordonia pseudamarae]|jgi:hypothetical protein|uniref:DUF7832 domain-containing protein n=1 Tax=Gordonia pseudamarae TaxID=2831662 RepID=A0ABX6IE74_9ACTN|nr:MULTISPECIES: hypothetical protein [Gordonia]MBD0021473.1 hypothetical protein [Gordonia sp. (in: high G+C Gram-positive bacteria)]QHN25224.1 hypothetical protein GII33_03815 [Gordonia pseudamarae]QHN34156.1 hypothetical protein GII31_03810 [Gordonia pseudamarae]
MTYDDAEWHRDTVGELGLDDSAADVHIGVYLAWAATRGLLSKPYASAASQVRSRAGTPAQLAHDLFVDQIDPGMLSPVGRRFTESAYSSYLTTIDTAAHIAGLHHGYELPDTWATYDNIVPLIDTLYESWVD